MKKSLHRDRREWVRRYDALGGVKFGQTPMYAGEAGRFAYLENLYRDHDNGHGAALETIPGFRTIFLGNGAVHGLYFYHKIDPETGETAREMLIHEGDTLWRYGVHDLMPEQAQVSVSSGSVQCNLKDSHLIVSGDKTEARRITLLQGKTLSRGGYTFSCEGSDTDAEQIQGVSLQIVLSGGQSYRIGIGEECAFFLEAAETIRVDVVLASQHEAFSIELQLQLHSASAGSTCLYQGLCLQKSCGFQMGSCFYLLDGEVFLSYDGERVREVENEDIDGVLWQDRSGKRILKQRNMLSLRFYNYFYLKESYTERSQLTFVLSDRSAGLYFAQYLKKDGTWGMLPIDRYTLEGGYLEVIGVYNADKQAYEVILPADIDLLQPYNIRVLCDNTEDKTISSTGREAFSVRHPTENIAKVIQRCTLACVHDGRVFLSGNPGYPGCVFYSERGNPCFFGSFDYFEDGARNSHVTGMTASGDTLLVCLAGDGTESAAFYHTRSSVSDDIVEEVYHGTPVAYNLYTTGVCLNFAGEITFLACDGLYGLARRNSFGERTVWRRSDSVDARLHRTNNIGACACVWNGYLCLLCPDGALYLADSRQTYKNAKDVMQYEWYYVSHIGVYEGQQYHRGTETSRLVPGEAYGGSFLPGTVLLSDEKTLYFGCADGSVCAFWFDKRLEDGSFSPVHYTQNGRRYPSVLLTARDDGEVPHLRKRTIPHSTLVRTGVHSTLQARVYIRTDNAGTETLSELQAWGLDFRNICFEGLTFSALDSNLFALAENAKGWMEKQYLFITDCFCGTLSLAELSYSYRLCGRYRAVDLTRQ